MAEQRIKASPTEASTILECVQESNAAIARADELQAVARKVFTMFAEGHGVPGATFVSIGGGEVVVILPDSAPQEEVAG